ncbi:MAG TPA: NAD(P)/FAD-dependent oxidoreductase [Jatrophihabitantaceae bacterium]|jgi:phytoene dehydrogenase-like protein|nr:NAD(P)/FAD-dependent oxidoreductase [Jatrophihabitantaceae bacterium]
MAAQHDAVIVGAGHNGLVAANLLADAGWDVLVLEHQDRAGGAIRSDGSLHPGFTTDWFSAFYPFAVGSPILHSLDLDHFGLRWSHAPTVLAHLLPDGRSAVLSRDLATTAASLDAFAPGDGAAWCALVAEYERIREPLLRALFTPFPPVRAGLRLAKAFGTADLLRFMRFAVQSVRRMGDERFTGAGAPLLLAGNALHSDLGPDIPGSAIYGWLLCMLGQTVGFPVPVGGSSAIPDALVARFESLGGCVRTSAEVTSIEISNGHATGIRLGDGERITTSTVLADVAAPHLYRNLIGEQNLPRRLVRDLDNFQWDASTLKVNWALSRPIPWTAADAVGAGTVHLAVDMNGLSRYATALSTKEMPQDPFLLLGQMTVADRTRSPHGTESVWAYTHVPQGPDFDAETIAAQVGRIEAVVERHAPGFTDSVLARRVQSPTDLEGSDQNLIGGAVAGGTANIYQQLVFRPVPGLGRAETPVDGVYLAGAGAHPGGGVHGGPGSNAALAALRRSGRGGVVRRRMIDAMLRRIYPPD